MAAIAPTPDQQGDAPREVGIVSTTPAHKRTYQACIPCRRRKIRCDLGPVDNPHDPPCARCMRESKECYFSATRRKKGSEDGGRFVGEGDPLEDYTARNVRRRTSYGPNRAAAGSTPLQQSTTTPGTASPALGSAQFSLNNRIAQQQDPSSIEGANSNGGSSPDDQVTNEAAAALFQSPVNQPKDALHLLLEASGRSEDLNRQRLAADASSLAFNAADSKGSVTSASRTQSGPPNPNIDPSLAEQYSAQDDMLSPQSKKVLKIWSRFRYVLAGWFSAKEALLYVDYFYDYLSPLTPIQVADIRGVSLEALSAEPMLVTTILTIASRYKRLSGPGGKTRSYMIHDRLGSALAAMISRMFWAQEPVRFGHKGSIQRPNSSVSLLRTMGSIESLLLLSEFHPRAMHFPPADDSDETLFLLEAESNESKEGDLNDPESERKTALTAWTEPSLRSGRMCWSLIGTAMYLAKEVGIFGGYGDGRQDQGSLAERRRADRIERLLFIYSTQTSGRLGIPNLHSDRRGPVSLEDLEQHLAVGFQLSPSLDPMETALRCWEEISSMGLASNKCLFPTKEVTAKLIETGDYFGWLRKFEPILHRWHQKLERLNLPIHARAILEIEYEHCRLYCMSLAVQAVLDQWTSKKNAEGEGANPAVADLYHRNEPFIKEFVDAARKLLGHVVDGANQGGFLRNCPVRTFARIISGATFLLKSLALGAKEADVRKSLGLLEKTVSALRNCVVDDIHLANRIADLLEGLTRSLGSKFIRLSSHRTGRSTAQQRPPEGHESQAIPLQAPNLLQPPPVGVSDQPITRSATPNIMPPPVPFYNNNFYNYNQQQNWLPPQYATSNPPSGSLSSGSAEEDWLTMDLTSLLGNNNNNGQQMQAGGTAATMTNGGFTTFGNLDMSNNFGNFGPDVGNNLEVLNRLVDPDEQVWQQQGYGVPMQDGTGAGTMDPELNVTMPSVMPSGAGYGT